MAPIGLPSRSIGADGVLSMVPGVGTLVGTGMSLYVIGEAVRHGVPARLLTRMGLNIAADTAVGAIPVIGFLFDMAFKANTRNLNLLPIRRLRSASRFTLAD